MDSHLKKKRQRTGGWLVLAGILPLILCVLFTFINARQIVVRQQAITAAMLLTQAETISDQAWDMIGLLHKFSGRACGEINDELREYAALYPYFRSLGVIQDDVITCSSAFGNLTNNVAFMIQRQLPEYRKAWWMLSVASTYAVQTRPAIIFMHETPARFSTFALVDGQYILDFMNAVGKSQGDEITLQFGGGSDLSSGGSGTHAERSLLNATTLTVASSRYPIVARIRSPGSEVAINWRLGLFTFLPMAAILSLLLTAVTNYWLKRRLSSRDQLRRAILHREFSVHYQPVYNVETGVASSAEALMRWQLPDGNWVRPDRFIATAEAENLIVPLTQLLIEMVIEDARSWTLPPDFRLAINVAADHIQHPDFVMDIRKLTAAMRGDQPNITLELTERSLLSDGEDVIQKLQLLRREGVHIAIDDFGTGHCSLSYLQTFPLDYLKIDRGFTNAIESVDGETPVLDAIIMLSHKLKLKIIAEGVETPVQLQYLKDRNVVFIQGYLYAWPMSGSALATWLEEKACQPLIPDEKECVQQG